MHLNVFRKNHIAGIFNADDEWCNTDDGIANAVEQYFQALFTSAQPSNMETVLDLVERLVTPDMNQQLLQPYTPEEIKRALFQMHPSKSPGPDGMSPFFFQKYWHIVGNNVVRAVLSVLNFGHLLHKMNYTHVILIPKKKEP